MRYAFVIVFLLLTSPALAGSAMVGGKRMSCGAARVIHKYDLNDLGYAKPGLIMLNPSMLSGYPSATQRLIFLHECAHQHVGFDNREAAADCWAVRRGRAQGWLNRRALDQICRSISHWTGTSLHLPGPGRCRAMRRCFNSGRRVRTSRR